MRRRSRQCLLACMQLLLCVDVCVSNTRRQPCSQDMGLEQLLQRARDLESVERSAAAAECLTLATRREPQRADVWMLLTELLQRSGGEIQASPTSCGCRMCGQAAHGDCGCMPEHVLLGLWSGPGPGYEPCCPSDPSSPCYDSQHSSWQS